MRYICVLFAFLIALGAYASTPDVDEAVRAVQALHHSMSSQTHLDRADGVARQITNRLLRTNPNKRATAAETQAMVDAHLYAELFYAFNTSAGNTIRDHRLIYDFIVNLASPDYAQDAQKQHLTILTILSLAAQEYFWNPRSNVQDLQKHVRRELRYGLYKMADNSLYVADRVYLKGPVLETFISSWVNDRMLDKLRSLRAQIEAPSSALMEALRAPLNAMQSGNRAHKVNLSGLHRAGEFGVPATELELLRFSSAGDDLCGFHSFFILNDGPRIGIEHNARAKMLQLLRDHIDDPELEKFYFLYSPFSDPGSVGESYKVGGTLPEALRAKYEEFKIIREQKNKTLNAASLHAKREAFKGVLCPTPVDFESLISEQPSFIGKSTSEEAKAAFGKFMEELSAAMGMSIDRLYTMGWDDISTAHFHALDTLIIKHKLKLKFFVDEKLPSSSLSRVVAKGSSDSDALLIRAGDIINAGRPDLQGKDQELREQFDNARTQNVIELKQWLLDNLWPLYKPFNPLWREDIIPHAKDLALGDGGLEGIGWIASNSNVLRLWALTHNENVFVWSEAEPIHGTSITRYSPISYFDITNPETMQYTQPHYDAAGALLADPTAIASDNRRLSDVVWTSPRAKRVYLTKSPVHYDKYIEVNDWSALARQKRHEEWKKLPQENSPRYAIYPAPKGRPLAGGGASAGAGGMPAGR